MPGFARASLPRLTKSLRWRPASQRGEPTWPARRARRARKITKIVRRTPLEKIFYFSGLL